jgi:hypothetical protein
MKLSKKTLAIFKNFANINQNMLIKAGNKQSTRSVENDIFSQATTEDDFPQDFGLYNLKEFLDVVGLFSDPDVEFGERITVISQGDYSIKFFAAECLSHLSLVSKPLPEFESQFSFDFSEAQIKGLMSAANIVGAKDVNFISDGDGVYVCASDTDRPNSNEVKIKLSDESDKKFNLQLKFDRMKFIPGDYRVEIISNGGGARWVKSTGEIIYVTKFQKNSTFGA